MRPLFRNMRMLSFLVMLSFSSAFLTTEIVRGIVKDLRQLSPELLSSLHSTHSVMLTCDCDLLAMKHLKLILDQVNPKTVSTSDKQLLGRIILRLDAIHSKKEGEKNCLRKAYRRLRKRTTVVPYFENLQHWLRTCKKPISIHADD